MNDAERIYGILTSSAGNRYCITRQPRDALFIMRIKSLPKPIPDSGDWWLELPVLFESLPLPVGEAYAHAVAYMDRHATVVAD